jgi:8-oxo-dGTP diphosphatase
MLMPLSMALLTVFDGAIHALLVRRAEHPDKDKYALPGTFVGKEEQMEDAAMRTLRDKAGDHSFARNVYLEQLYTFGEPGRDPRTRVITIAYYALVDRQRFKAAAGDAEEVIVGRLEIPWEGETGGPVQVVGDGGEVLETAFDHDSILGMAVKRLRGKLNYTPIGFQLLPEQFTLRQLQDVHETILGRPLNKDSFRRRMLATEMLEATGRLEQETAHRPAELYRFTKRGAV